MPNQHHQADLIIAGASVRSLAQSCIADGLRPMCIDLFSDSDLQHLFIEAGLPTDHIRLIKSFDQLESELETIAGNIPLVPVGGLELASRALNRIRIQRPVFAMVSDVIEQLRKSQVVFPYLKEAGHSVPNFYCGNTKVYHVGNAYGDDQSHDLSDPKSRWLKKDGMSSGGQSVMRIDSRQWQQYAESLQPSEYLQEEVAGIPCSATFLATLNADSVAPNRSLRLLGCSMQICGQSALNAKEFQFCGNAGPVHFSKATESELLSIAATLQQRWRLQGTFGIDFIWNSGNVSVIEINPRLTASHEITESSTANGRSHILEHCLQFQPAAFSDFRTCPEITSVVGFARIPCTSRILANPTPSNREAVSGQLLSSHGFHSHDPPTQVRLILYSEQTFLLSLQQQQRMLQLTRLNRQRSSNSNRPTTQSTADSVWLSDIPEAGATIEAADPFCSINFAAAHVNDLVSAWENLNLQAQLSFLKIHEFTEMVTAIQHQLTTLQGHHEGPTVTERG